jgi:hypothetical protein
VVPSGHETGGGVGQVWLARTVVPSGHETGGVTGVTVVEVRVVAVAVVVVVVVDVAVVVVAVVDCVDMGPRRGVTPAGPPKWRMRATVVTSPTTTTAAKYAMKVRARHCRAPACTASSKLIKGAERRSRDDATSKRRTAGSSMGGSTAGSQCGQGFLTARKLGSHGLR